MTEPSDRPAPRFADDPDRLLSYAELAQWANAPERTVRQWVYRGDGPPALRIGRYRRFRVRDVLTWLDTRYVQEPPRPPPRTPPEPPSGGSRNPVLRWDLTPPPQPDDLRRGAEHAANAALAANAASSQVSHGAGSAATGAATARQAPDIAAPAAYDASRRTYAAPDAAPFPPHLTGGNKDHAANAANAATTAHLLCSPDVDTAEFAAEPFEDAP